MKVAILSIVIVLVLVVTIFLIINEVRGNDFKDDDTTYIIRR